MELLPLCSHGPGAAGVLSTPSTEGRDAGVVAREGSWPQHLAYGASTDEGAVGEAPPQRLSNVQELCQGCGRSLSGAETC